MSLAAIYNDARARASVSAASPITYNPSTGEFGFDDTGFIQSGDNISLLTNDSGYLTTVDISADTNLAVSSPIVLTGDTLSFDDTVDFTWTGTHTFQVSESPSFTINGTISETVQNVFNVVPTYASPGSGTFNGLNFVPTFSGSKSITSANLALALGIFSPYSGTATEVNGFNSSMVLAGGGTYETVRQFYGKTVASGATVETYIGLDLEDITAGSTNYAIRTGAGTVELGDITNLLAGLTVTGKTTLDTATESTQIGPYPLHLAINNARDGAAVILNSSATTQKRAFLAFAEYDGSNGTSSGNLYGANLFAHVESQDDMTGIVGGSRIVVRNYGDTNTLDHVHGQRVWYQFQGSGGSTVDEYIGFYSEPVDATGNTINTYYDALLEGPAGGTIGVRHGAHIASSAASPTTEVGLYVEDMADYAIQTGAGAVELGDDTSVLGQLLIANGNTPYTTPYTASIQSSAASTFLEILSNAGEDTGMFFGVENSNAVIYSWSGGDFIVYTGTSAGSAIRRFTIEGDGTFEIGRNLSPVDLTMHGTGGDFFWDSANAELELGGELSVPSDKKIYLEGTGSDTYLVYDSASTTIKFYVNGTYVGGFGP